MTKKILTLKQVADYLKVHHVTIYRLVRRKELPAFKIWHRWRFDLELIDQWRVEQEQKIKTALGDQLWVRDGRDGPAILNDTTSNDSCTTSIPVEDLV
ncbi:MAG: helix-turn-helix domain-containing protein [Deltaproteobacteria bacterium]|nr:helix-turn-helix domain-containing protein [Deltaproteobacteria bacterium]MBV8451509.1 helix-turn-helix domain-containing protein [Deltaproteobacteria bacterium]